MNKLNSRQHRFVLNLFSGMSQTDAYIKAGYPVDRKTAAECASVLSTNLNVSQELDRLRRGSVAVVEESIMSPFEIQQHLATIARTKIANYTKVHLKGEPIATLGVKLSDPIEAIREVNKMQGNYAPSKHLVANVKLDISYYKRTKDSETE